MRTSDRLLTVGLQSLPSLLAHHSRGVTVSERGLLTHPQQSQTAFPDGLSAVLGLSGIVFLTPQKALIINEF